MSDSLSLSLSCFPLRRWKKPTIAFELVQSFFGVASLFRSLSLSEGLSLMCDTVNSTPWRCPSCFGGNVYPVTRILRPR